MTFSKCLKDECEHKDEKDFCKLDRCVHYFDENEKADIEYHRKRDEGEV